MKKKLIFLLVILFTFCTGVSAATIINSKDVIYDNSKSGMESTNVQAAVDELYAAAADYSSLEQRIAQIENGLLSKTYPIGSIYISVDEKNPSTLFGGEWEKYGQGKTLIGEGTGTDSNGIVKIFDANSTGGEYTHTLSIDEMPKHKHNIRVWIPESLSEGDNITGPWKGVSGISTHSWSVSDTGIYDEDNVNQGGSGPLSTGGSQAHNIVQPYITVYMWKRVK